MNPGDLELCASGSTFLLTTDCDGDGVLESGDAAEFRLNIRNKASAYAEVVDPDIWLECSCGNLEVECGENQSIRYPDMPNDGSCHLPERPTASFDVGAPHDYAGTCDVQVWYAYDGSGGLAVMDEAYTIEVRPQAWLAASPSAYYFTAEHNTCIDAPIAIRNHGTEDLAITEMYVNGSLPPQIASVSVDPLEVLPWHVGARQSLARTVHICTSAVRGGIDPPLEIVFSTDACYDESDDRIRVTGTVGSVAVECVPEPNPGLDSNAFDIRDTSIVWNAGQIFSYDVATKDAPEQITTPPALPGRARISDSLIAWTDRRNWDGVSDTDTYGLDVYAYDRESEQICPVATDPVTEILLGVSGDMIAFERVYEVFSEQSNWDAAHNLVVLRQ